MTACDQVHRDQWVGTQQKEDRDRRSKPGELVPSDVQRQFSAFDYFTADPASLLGLSADDPFLR